MEYWRCAVCDIEMQLQSRDSHLSGKRHAAAAEAYQKSIVEVERSQKAQKQWTCTICNIEMQVHSRDSHLAGSRHAIAAGLYQENVYHPQETPIHWTCTICNIQMQMQNRDSHLSGKRHAMSTRSQQQENSLSPTAKVFLGNSGIHGFTGNTMYTAPDLTEVYGATVVLVWQCMMCSCYMPLSEKQSHLSSIDHMQKLLETIQITCMAMPQLQVEVYRNSLGGKEKLDYQEMVSGTETMAPYPLSRSQYKEASPKSSAINPSLESVAPPNLNARPDTFFWTCPDCRTVLAADQKAIHSCLYLQSTPVSSTGPLDAFFLSFSGYQYNPSIPPAESFQSFRRGLGKWNDWDGRSPTTWKEYQEDVILRYQAALTREFNLWFGTEDDIKSWHSLCRAINIHPLPTTCEECREAVRDRHVNIVDLIQWGREREVGHVRIFKTVKELSEYSYKEGKIYHKDQIGQGVVLRHLLRLLRKALMSISTA